MLKTGDTVPDFTLYDTDRKPRSMKEFLGKTTLLAFYPGAFTGVCTTEMCHWRDAMATMGSLGVQVVGISVDSPFANGGFAKVNNISYPLLSDFDRAVSKKIVGLYDGFGKVPGYTASKRAVLVVDAKGVVKYVWSTENPGEEPPYDAVKAALKTA
jgi:peroxiredoxin